MKLSVIILNYNVRYFLELCLHSVQKATQTIDSEVLVIDNASSDKSIEAIKNKFPDVIFIQNTENVGFPKGNNIGVAQAKGDYICILNPDTVVAEDTFEKLLPFAENEPTFGALGCHLVDGSGNFLPESKRGIPTPWVALTKIFSLYKIFPKSTYFNQYYAQHISEFQTGKVAILVGAFMLMKRNLYVDLQGFDENCFMYADDIDLSYRILKTGNQNFYVPSTSVIHFKGESTVKDKQYLSRFSEAMQYFYAKHFKKSFVFDVFMKLGSVVFAFIKKNQSQPKTIAESYIIVSNSEENIQKIGSNLTKKYYIWKNLPEKDVISQTISQGKIFEIIFDVESLSCLSCIEFMKKYCQKNIIFSFAMVQSGFKISSQSSVDKGEVSQL